MAKMERVNLPTFGGLDEDLPPIPHGEYEERIQAVLARMHERRLDVLVVYADREHFANMAFLVGFEPRFEEALLVLDSRGNRTLLVGNECMGYLPDSRLNCRAVLFQDFSLMGQSRAKSLPLRRILSDLGIGTGVSVGCVGWKYFSGSLVDQGENALEIPSYIADLLRDLAGQPGLVRNATPFLMNPSDGLRVVNSANQIAQFEYASIRTSESILSLLRHIREDVEERELEKHYQSGGLILTCHPMISFGEKARRGLSSPSGNRARRGDAFTAAYGIQGALTCRAGAVARGPQDLAPELRGFFEPFAACYFDVVAAWYERVSVGAAAGDVFDAVEARRDPKWFDFAVNPGHYIHLDEWVHSPFERGSRIVLRSGMALQMDIIPVSKGPFCTVNAEDSIALADERLRAELASRFPACWRRIEMRREFMQGTLGIHIGESVLPLSNMPGWLAPYALAPEMALVNPSQSGV